MNLSLANGFVPDEMKIAKVIPIHKAGEKSEFNNFRPISLLPIFSKILERLVYTRIITFIESNKYFYQHQYGFRKGHCTIHPIVQFLNEIHTAKENRPPKVPMGIFIDLSKAFDTISHEILLYKLEHMGIRGLGKKLIKDYLTNREQFIEIDYTRSSLSHITCGVPQGSILGPLLFLIYMNDISNLHTNSMIMSFADDTTLILSGINIEDLYTKANHDLYTKANHDISELTKWLSANKLTLNAKKTKYTIFGHQVNNNNQKLKINNQEIEQINENKSIKFLGVHIDKKLTWKNHVHHINSKLSQINFVLNKIKIFVPKTVLKTLYYTLFQPHLNYNILAWGNAPKTILKRTTILQKRAIRTICLAKYNSHTDPLFKMNKILKANDLYEVEAIRFMLKYEDNKLPESFKSSFKTNAEINPNRIRTRNADDYYIKSAKTKLTEHLPCISLPKVWNKWNHNIKTTTGKKYIKQVSQQIINSYMENVTCTNEYCRQCNPNNS